MHVCAQKQDRAIHSKFTIPMDEFVRGDLRDAKVPTTSHHHQPPATTSHQPPPHPRCTLGPAPT
jgi:hypothetical protein